MTTTATLRPSTVPRRTSPRPVERRGGEAERWLTVLALAAGGGRQADIDAFVSATHQDVWRFVAYLGSPEAADDLAQETYLRVLRALPSFAGRSSARTWLMSIARRTVVDRYRYTAARPRCVPLPDAENPVEWLLGPPGGRFEEEFALIDLLARVEERRRKAFVLTQLTGFSYREAARMLRCPVGTVRSRVARAREDLADLLRAADRS